MATEAPMFLMNLECLEPNMDFRGNDLVNVDGLADPHACRVACQGHTDCRAFTFNLASGRCILKGDVELRSRVPFTNAISGTRDCQEGERTELKCLQCLNQLTFLSVGTCLPVPSAGKNSRWVREYPQPPFDPYRYAK